MATWAVTSYKQTVFGDERVVYATMVATGTYTAAGDTINASSFGLDYVDLVNITNALAAAAPSTTAFLTVVPTALPATSFKLQLFGDSGGGAGSALSEASGSITGANCTIEVRGV